MPRRPRGELRGAIHHILNRGNNRATLFHDDGDFRAFIDAIWEARQSVPTRIYEFTIKVELDEETLRALRALGYVD